MIKKTNKRIAITLSKKQINWLEKFAKSINMTKSECVKWLISKNAQLLAEYIYAKTNNFDTLEELYRIAKTPWLDD